MHYSIVGVVARPSLDRNSKYFFVKYIMNGRLKEGWTTLIYRSCILRARAISIIHISRSLRNPGLPGSAGLSAHIRTNKSKDNNYHDSQDSDSSDGDSQDKGD